MIIALIDNGSLEPGAHINLRRVAAALSGQVGVAVHAVSWKHSDLIPATALSEGSENPRGVLQSPFPADAIPNIGACLPVRQAPAVVAGLWRARQGPESLDRLGTLSSSNGLVVGQAMDWRGTDFPVRDVETHGLESPCHESAWTLAPWLRTQRARGEVDFVFVPFFVSAQGAIGSALRDDLEALRRETGHFEFAITDGLAARGAIVRIVAERIRETITANALSVPAVIVVDHGGPAPASAALRDEFAAQLKVELGGEVGALAAASMEGTGYAHNHPLLAGQLTRPGFNRGDVVIAPLFLSPGRHAGPNGDLAQIARAACPEPAEWACPELVERACPEPVEGACPELAEGADGRVASPLRCHFTGLVGTHPHAIDALATALRHTLSTFSDHAAA